MKQLTLLSAILLTVTVLNVSCNKDRGLHPLIEIDETNLTSCPANARCENLFVEHTDLIDGSRSFKSGAYRLFWAGIDAGGISSYLYIKAPMDGDSFSLNKEDILAQRVIFMRSCATCFSNSIDFKPVDGYVRGRNLTPEKPADQTKWLLEVKIILEAVGSPSTKETIYVKQYFYPNFIYN